MEEYNVFRDKSEFLLRPKVLDIFHITTVMV